MAKYSQIRMNLTKGSVYELFWPRNLLKFALKKSL